MRHLFKTLVLFTALLSINGVLCAQPPDLADRISGQIIDADTQEPIAKARIAIFHNGHALVQETKSTKDGKFVAAGLLNRHQRQATDSYVLLVRAEGYVMKILSLQPDGKEAQKIELSLNAGREIRVADSQGQPVANAAIQVLSVYAPPAVWTEANPWFSVAIGQLEETIAPEQGDETGLVLMNTLSPNVGKVIVRAPGFASQEVEVGKIGDEPIRLSRETVIKGRFVYKDTGLPFYHPTPVAKVQSGQKYHLWRQSHIREDGTFEIADIPSLESLGDKTLSINLELNIPHTVPAVVGSGMTIRYAPAGYNAFVTLEEEKDGQKKWYLSYYAGGETGVLYEEGEHATYDFFLEPLARIKGRVLLLPGQEPARVSYHDPKSLYGDWNVLTDIEGNFEIFAPEGDVTMKFKSGENSGELLLKDLKGHETREVELEFDK